MRAREVRSQLAIRLQALPGRPRPFYYRRQRFLNNPAYLTESWQPLTLMTLFRIDIPQTPAPIRSTTASIDGVGLSARELGARWNSTTGMGTLSSSQSCSWESFIYSNIMRLIWLMNSQSVDVAAD